jgi:lipopolysaccharide transport system permease protein
MIALNQNALANIEHAARRGWSDLVEGLENWRVWHLMGVSLIRKRYRRSRLGQFWITFSMGIMVLVLGITWSVLWHQSVADFLPYIGCSLIIWTFFSVTIGDAANVAVNSGALFLNQNMSFSVAIYAVIYNNVIILLHNSIIVFILFVVFRTKMTLSTLLFVPGFFMALTALVWVSCVIAILCARYRDVMQLVQMVLQCALFVTPVMYKATFVPPEYEWINLLNPFAVYIAIVRDPIIGEHTSAAYWMVAAIFAFGGGLFSLPFIGNYRKRVVLWI